MFVFFRLRYSLFALAALNSRDPAIICAMLLLLQQLVLSADRIGEALVPYYRQILPIFNLFKLQNCAHFPPCRFFYFLFFCEVNSGDAIDYGQQKKSNVGDLVLTKKGSPFSTVFKCSTCPSFQVEETLALFELKGGDDAFINIKYMIPTYESHVLN